MTVVVTGASGHVGGNLVLVTPQISATVLAIERLTGIPAGTPAGDTKADNKSETKSETSTPKVTTTAKERKNWPMMPDRKITGAKIETSDSVAAITS